MKPLKFHNGIRDGYITGKHNGDFLDPNYEPVAKQLMEFSRLKDIKKLHLKGLFLEARHAKSAELWPDLYRDSKLFFISINIPKNSEGFIVRLNMRFSSYNEFSRTHSSRIYNIEEIIEITKACSEKRWEYAFYVLYRYKNGVNHSYKKLKEKVDKCMKIIK